MIQAVFMPPVKGAPRFDVVLLVRATSPGALGDRSVACELALNGTAPAVALAWFVATARKDRKC